MKKKLFISISLLAILVGCTHQFKGFLVCKEYVPGHMDDKKSTISAGSYRFCSTSSNA